VNEVFITAFLAVVTFIGGQALLRFVVEPIQEQRRLIGEVAHALRFYANAYSTLDFDSVSEQERERLGEAQKALRELEGRLLASLWTIPYYDALALLRMVPKKYDVLDASKNLVGWSNNLYGEYTDWNIGRRTIIADRLGITKKIGQVG
jgi:hypothetical protein